MAAVAAAMAVLLVLCGLAAGSGTLLSSQTGRSRATGPGASTSRAGRGRFHLPRHTPAAHLPRATPTSVPSWVWLLLLGALVALAVVVALIVLRGHQAASDRYQPLETPALSPAAQRASLQAGVAAALADLDEEADPRAGVVACWLRLEASLQGLHAGRTPSETSAELAARVLGAYAVDPETLQALHLSYQIARFSTEPVTEAMRDQARTALRTVNRQLVPQQPVSS